MFIHRIINQVIKQIVIWISRVPKKIKNSIVQAPKDGAGGVVLTDELCDQIVKQVRYRLFVSMCFSCGALN
jgi:hypothetical protein